MARPAAREDVFRAIADPTRRALLDLLRRGARPVGALAGEFDLSLPAVSQHLRVLREVDLVREERDGRRRVYQLNPAPLRHVVDWLSHYQRFWERKLDALDRYLEKTK
jgi:DNA-binding transcriptional ArsR family regulator